LGEALDRCADVSIALSGCPNACGRHLMADLGFCGRISRHQDTPYPAYSVFVGARLVPDAPQFARRIGEVPARALPEVIAAIVQHTAEKRRVGERFTDYLARCGETEITALCARHQAPPAAALAPEYYQDWGAPEPFRTKSAPT